MKNFIVSALFLLSFSLISKAQDNDREAFLPKEDFLGSCIEGGKAEMGEDGATQFCNCAYEKIINDLSDSDFQKVITLANKGKKSFLQMPEIKLILGTCLSNVLKTDETAESENKTQITFKKTFMETCVKNIKKDKTLSKMFDAEEYCNCNYDKLINEVGIDEIMSPTKATKAKIEAAAVQCVTELLGGSSEEE
jgi:hypothetical protein